MSGDGFSYDGFRYYFLLYNKLFQNLTAEDNKHLLSHRVSEGQEDKSGFTGVVLAQDLSWNHSQVLGYETPCSTHIALDKSPQLLASLSDCS